MKYLRALLLLALVACQREPSDAPRLGGASASSDARPLAQPDAALAAGQQAPSDAEQSVRPGANDQFLTPDLDVAHYTEVFEGESREIATSKVAIADAIGLEPGMEVADVGAGTGLFLELLADRVGAEGKIWELDIAPQFVDHLRARAEKGGYAQVEARLCSERSIELPPASIDVAFLCDVYHHFEYPRSTMSSIRSALRPGGRVVIVDFERIPGKSRPWVMNHVRTGKAEVLAELRGFGFELLEEEAIPGLAENYFVRLGAR
jgi:SAM-dependent methyltransferase